MTRDNSEHKIPVKQKRVYKTTNKKKEDKETLYCHYCENKYHREECFWKKLKELSLKEKTSRNRSNNDNQDKEDSEFVCSMDTGYQDQWILDSESSQHVTNNLKLLYDKVQIKEIMDMEKETTEE